MSFSTRTLPKDKVKKAKKPSVVSKVLATICTRLHNKKSKKPTSKNSKNILQALFFIAMALLFAALIFALVLKVLVALRIISVGSFMNTVGTSPTTDAHGYVNVLLLGQGDRGHDGLDLTDTIMIASIDTKKTNSVIMTSIPRDTMVTTDFFGERAVTNGRRINSVYRDIKGNLMYTEGLEESEARAQALEYLEKEITRLTDIELYGSIKVDFIGFEKVVDAMGGLEVDVPYNIVDFDYPDSNFGYETFRIQKGLQTLDGATALKYARSRHTTSDFSRSAHQQQIIAALGQKAKDEGMLKKPQMLLNIISIAAAHFESTLTTSELLGLANAGRSIDRANVKSFQLNDRNGLYNSITEPAGMLYAPPREEFNGAAVLLPVSIPQFPVTWKQPQTFFKLQQEFRQLYIDNPRINVLNAGAKSGLARRLGNELIRYGFTVTDIDNADLEEDLPTSVIFIQVPIDADGKEIFAESTLHSLSRMLQLPAITEVPPVPSDQQEIITIILGEDFSYTPLQDLSSSGIEN